MNDERLLSTSEAAHYLAADSGTLKRWRTKGGGPPYVKISANRCRYSFEALRAWTAERTRRNTAENPRGLAA
jgi:predicted DNA-binding transcriptional regulator AlpA